MSTYEDWKLVLLSPWGTVGIALAGLLLVVALLLSVWSYRRQRRWSVRLLLSFVRLFGLAVLLMLVLQPAIQLRNVTRIPNHLIVLVDLSRSMSIRQDESQKTTRMAQVVALLKQSVSRLESWRRTRVVEMLSFGASVKPVVGDVDQLRATEPATHIREALAGVKRMFQDKDLAAVVLISDGIDNGRFGTRKLAEADRRFLRGLSVPIHTVWVGQSEIRDLAIAEVYADDFAFVRNAVPVEVDLLASGLADVRIPVTLERDGQVVAQREVQVSRDTSRYRVRFEFVPQRVGKYVYTVSVPVHTGEALASNNSRSFILKVIRDRIRVLQVCGRPSWDERFLRRLLKRDPNVDLISFFILRTPTDLALVPTSELSLIPFPTDELFAKELGSFDLVLLQNFNYKPYGIGAYLPHLRRFVEGGGGLAMIGGGLSFSSGEYHGTSLAEVLPVNLLPQNHDPDRLVSDADFRLRITAQGQDHPILQVGTTRHQSQQMLAQLPQLSGANLVRGVKPRATVLAVHPALKTQEGKPMPLLATMEVEKGRTLALTTDSSWHWAFLSVGQGGTRQAYDRFWRNTVRWLIQDPELKYLRVIVQQHNVRRGMPFRAVIRAYNPDYSPAKGIRVVHRVSAIDGDPGEDREASTDGEGEIDLEFTPPSVGAYRIHAQAVIGGRETTEDALVLVDPAGPEEREPRAVPVLLRQLAQATSGRHLDNPSALPELPMNESKQLRVNWRRDIELWSNWWSLLVCVLLLGLEWLLRRRFGYL